MAATGLILNKVGRACYCADFGRAFPTFKPPGSITSLIFGSCVGTVMLLMHSALSQTASNSLIKLATDETFYNEALFLFRLLKCCLSSSFKPLAFKHRFASVVLCVASLGQPHWLAVTVYDKDNKTSIMSSSLWRAIFENLNELLMSPHAKCNTHHRFGRWNWGMRNVSFKVQSSAFTVSLQLGVDVQMAAGINKNRLLPANCWSKLQTANLHCM